MTTNLNNLYQLVRDIAGETAWMLEMLTDYERNSREAHPRFAQARTLVSELDIAARRDLPLELATLWNTLGAVAASAPGTPIDTLPDPTRPARRIIEILEHTAYPIGILIQTIEAEQRDTSLAFLLMSGMAGVFTATTALRDQLNQMFTPAPTTPTEESPSNPPL
jgi:hypothetical protein